MSRDNALWQQCWRDRNTDFHQKTVNPHLIRFWPTLKVTGRVLVPLCGKSLDIVWLAQQGHAVLGVELSSVAIRAFFRENHMQPVRKRTGQFTLWKHGKIEILCGDFFQLAKHELGEISGVYDRAALTALPEDLRRAYLAHLKEILSPACKVLLLTTEDLEADEVSDAVSAEIASLYAPTFHIELAHVEHFTEQIGANATGRVEHKVYRLIPRIEAGGKQPVTGQLPS